MARPTRTSERGFTYLMLLLWVVLAGVMLAALGTSWHQMARRDREAEYLWRGEQYRQALQSYGRVSAAVFSSASSPAGTFLQQGQGALLPDAAAGARGLGRPPSASTLPSMAAASAPNAAASQAASPVAGPMELRELLEDRRTGKLVRHLRQLYGDPLTGSPTWGLRRSADGRITGVYSLSTEQPVRSSLGVERYRDLTFSPAAGVGASAPAGVASGADTSVVPDGVPAAPVQLPPNWRARTQR